MKRSPRAAAVATIVVGISLALWSQTTAATGQTYTDIAGTSASTSRGSGALAFTGSSSMTMTLLLIGIGLVCAGALFLFRSRMRPTSDR